MDKLPEEILLRIFKLLVYNVEHLAKVSQVSTHFYRIAQDPRLWYLSFQERYPIWGSRIQYASNSERLIDWKDFVIHLIKQQNSTKEFTFQFVNEEVVNNTTGRKRKLQTEDDIDMIIDKYLLQKKTLATTTGIEDDEVQVPFWIQDPLVVDIDRITKNGVVATGKHRKNVTANRSEHKILFWEYPSWKLIRSFKLNLTPPNLTCQIIGIQSILMPTAVDGKGRIQKARFFSLAVGMALIHEQAEIEDRVDIWKSLFVYRLFDDGSTHCVSHIKVADIFLGREIFLFSDTSWCKSSDGNNHSHDNNSNNQLIDWLNIVSPKDAKFDSRFTVFLLAIGPIDDHTGCVQLAKFDLRGQYNILDPSITPVHWNPILGQISPLRRDHYNYYQYYNSSNPANFIFGNPTEVITTIRLGSDVSCMIHFKYPPSLNHLICTGSYQDDELSVYDWRFGIKVGSLPWKSSDQTSIPPQLNTDITAIHTDTAIDDDTNAMEAMMDVRPWGLESTLVLPPYWSNDDAVDLSKRGFRLIAVGDNRSDNARDKLEIKVWDISYLLQVKWNPLLKTEKPASELDLSYRFTWWPRRTKELEILALNMMQQQLEEITTHISSSNQDIQTTNTHNNRSISYTINNIPPHLPYSPPKEFQSMLLSHTFDKEEGNDNMIPVKYTAYNVLYTSLFLLTEDGKVTVMDIETGKITGTVQNVAATESQQVRGIDVNVIAGKEVVVTSKEGLLRGIVH